MERKKNQADDQQKVNERLGHAEHNKSQCPDNKQNARDDKQRHVSNLSGEDLCATKNQTPQNFCAIFAAVNSLAILQKAARENCAKGNTRPRSDKIKKCRVMRKRQSRLRNFVNSSTLIALLAESPHLTRYRLLHLQFKF
jgi:hypothetical protein